MKLKLLITILLLCVITSLVSSVDVNPKNVQSSTIDASLNWNFDFTRESNSFTFETFDFPNDEFTSSEVVSATAPFEKQGNLLKFSLPAGESGLAINWRVTNLKNRVEKVTESPDALKQYTYQSKYVEITPAITQKAMELTQGETNGLKKVTLIAQWVHRNIEYDLSIGQNTMTSSQVYSARIGVCNEFSHLFIAMVRSIGIPARFVGGFVYSGEEWAPHAWAEVAYNGEWISFDPTYNEGYLLDGTHFKFASGFDQSNVKEQLSFSKSSGDVEITRSHTIKFTNIKQFNHAPLIQIKGKSELNATSGEVVKITTELSANSFSKILPISIAMPKEVKNTGETTALLYLDDSQSSVEWNVLMPNDLEPQYKYVYPVVFSTLGEDTNITINAAKGKLEDAYFLVSLKEARLLTANSFDLDQNVILSLTLENKGNAGTPIELQVQGNSIPWQKLTVNLQEGEEKEVQIRTNATQTQRVTGELTLTVEDKSQISKINLNALKTQKTENPLNATSDLSKISLENTAISLPLIVIVTILILITFYLLIRKKP